MNFLINGKYLASNSLFRMDDKNSNASAQAVPIKGPFYSRIGHKAIRLNDQVLVFGGTGLSGQFMKTILRFNLEKLKIEPLSTPMSPGLEGFSLFAHKGNLYLWGGSLENKSCNSLWQFQGSSLVICTQKGDVPSPRSFHCSCYISEKYVLVFGGFSETEIFNDWYLLNCQTLTWSRMQTSRELPKNMKFQLVWVNGRGYLLSQYQVSKMDSKCNITPKNQLFQIRIISFSSSKLRIDPCQFDNHIFSPRFNFYFMAIDSQLWVLGGQFTNSNKSEGLLFSNQIWTFNTQTLEWVKKKMSINVKIGFQVVGYKNKLYLLGGIRSASEMSTNVEIINFRAISQYETQVCNFCKNVFSLDEKWSISNSITTFKCEVKDQHHCLTQISTNFLSKLSRTLQNPIQAIGLLVDNSLNMGSSSISINIKTPMLNSNYFKESPSYLYIGDNSKAFSSEQITKILFSFRFKVQKYYRDHIDKEDIKMRNQYGLNLKLASLRLGTSCLFVTNTIEDHIFVAYFSDLETQCPDGDPSFNCFYYTLDQRGVCSNNLNRQIIRENVKHLISEDEYLLMKVHSTKVHVIGLHDVIKNQGINGKYDICYTSCNAFPLSSLSDYISKLYLNPFLGRELFLQQSRIGFTNLITKFKEDERNNLIQQVDTTLELNIFSKISLYRVIKSSYQLNYVYIYHQNRLIYTISSRGKLICGFLEVPAEIQVDFYRTKIERWQQEKKLVDYIHSKQQQWKRQRKGQKCPQETEGRKISSLLQF